MIAIVVQARMSSTRLPGKVLMDIEGKPSLRRVVERLRHCRRTDVVAVATSDDPSDDAIAALCRTMDCPVFRGALGDVLARYAGAARAFRADHVVRITADCPLIDPEIVDRAIELHLRSGSDYTANTLGLSYPDGLDVEVMRADALYRADAEARDPTAREHVTPYLREGNGYRSAALAHDTDLSRLRWTVDTPLDLEFVRAIYRHLPDPDRAFRMVDTLRAAEDARCFPTTPASA